MKAQWNAWLLSAALGITAPAIALSVAVPPAIAQTSPNGTFSDGTWRITVGFSGSHTYYGENVNSGDSLYLSGAQVTGDNSRRVYTWNNSGTRYEVSWRPSDRNVIRLRVLGSNGRELMNRLLYRVPN